MSDTSEKFQSQTELNEKPVRTPHEFINHHLQNPDEPITDEDIRNLKIDSGAVSKEHGLTRDETILSSVSTEESKDRAHKEEEPADGRERPKESPYDILNN